MCLIQNFLSNKKYFFLSTFIFSKIEKILGKIKRKIWKRLCTSLDFDFFAYQFIEMFIEKQFFI